MPSVKQSVLNAVMKRASKIKKEKSQNRDIIAVVATCIEEANHAIVHALNEAHCNAELESVGWKAVRRLRYIDPGVQVCFMYESPETVTSWRDQLRVSGVTITWSDTHVTNNPGQSKEELVDAFRIALES